MKSDGQGDYRHFKNMSILFSEFTKSVEIDLPYK